MAERDATGFGRKENLLGGLEEILEINRKSCGEFINFCQDKIKIIHLPCRHLLNWVPEGVASDNKTETKFGENRKEKIGKEKRSELSSGAHIFFPYNLSLISC